MNITKIKEILEANEENLIVMTLYTQNFIKNVVDSNAVHQARASFLKKLKKTEAFWYTDYFQDFLENKITEKKQDNKNLDRSDLNNKSLNSIIKYLFSFFVENQNFCPSNFDMREVS